MTFCFLLQALGKDFKKDHRSIVQIMIPEEFIKAYESALATQDWNRLDKLISDQIAVTFSDGTVHVGKDEVQIAFEKNFASIKSEKYTIQNVKWLRKEEPFAVYLFEFYWTGIVNGKSVSGNGIGTSVIVNEEGRWKLLTEHLGKKTT